MVTTRPVSDCIILCGFKLSCFRRRSAVPLRDSCVQTGVDVGLYYNWPAASHQAVADAQYGLAFVDPASVAVSVVSADALEGKS